MKVPLIVTNYKTKENEFFVIWSNGKSYNVHAPIKPYFYSYDNMEIPNADKTKVKARALSDFQEHTFYKYSFKTRAQLTSFRDLIRNDEKYKNLKTFEDNIPFILRNRIDNPDIFSEYKHTDDIIFHSIDIEQETPPDKIFPTSSERIISISFRNSGDKNIRTIYCKSKKSSDKPVLEKYKELYGKYSKR